MTTDRTWGIEIEAISASPISIDAVARAIRERGIHATSAYSHLSSGDGRSWHVKHDGSLTGGYGVEVTSPTNPALTFARVDEVEKVCAALQSLGYRVNSSCGLHCHVYARDLPIQVQRKLAIDYADYQGVIHGVLPASRRPGGPGQRYARSLSLDGSSRDAIAIAASDRDIAAILYHGRRSATPGRRRRGSWTERWVALNFTARWRHGTVEFRQHSGTVNARKIVAWARFCVAMVEAARKNPTIVSGGRVVANPARFGLDESGRRRTFVRLITSPEGTTREDVFRETGWRRGSLTMRRFAQEAGLEIFRQRRQDNGHVRYWARPVDQSAAPIAAADAAPKTLDTLVAVLELSPEDAEYWRSRSRFFAGGGGNDIPDEG